MDNFQNRIRQHRNTAVFPHHIDPGAALTIGDPGRFDPFWKWRN